MTRRVQVSLCDQSLGICVVSVFRHFDLHRLFHRLCHRHPSQELGASCIRSSGYLQYMPSEMYPFQSEFFNWVYSDLPAMMRRKAAA